MKALHFLIITFCTNSVLSQLPMCENDAIQSVTFNDVTPKYSMEVFEHQIHLNLDISWEMIAPQGVKIDGFLVLFTQDEKRDSLSKIQPTNVCNTGFSSYWVNATDDTTCSKSAVCNYFVTPFRCLQDVTNTPNCMGTCNFYMKLKAFLSIHSGIQSLQYSVSFNKEYKFEIYAYYREFVNFAMKTILNIKTPESCQLATMEMLPGEYTKNEISNLCAGSPISDDIFDIGSSIVRPKRFTRRRFCRDPSGLISKAFITNFTYEYVIDLRNDSATQNSTQLILNIGWDAVVPEGLTLDGFIVHVAISEYPTPPSMFPINVCAPGYDHFWVRLNESSHDNATSNASCTNATGVCNAYVTSSQCLCDLNCDLTDITCRGTGTYYIEDQNFFSVPNDVRFLQFDADFHSFYTVKIYPYYREFFHRGPPTNLHHYNIDRQIECPKLVASANNNSVEANQICCDLGIPLVLARDFTYEEPVLDYNTGTANITVSWLPPLSSGGFVTFYMYPTTAFFGLRGDLLHPVFTDVIPMPYTPPGNVAECDNTSTIYKTTLFQLYPTQTYMLHVTSIYEDPEHDLYRCGEAACVTIFELTVPEIHACDQKWNYCDDNAVCSADDVTGWETLNATCTCAEGFSGNGRNATTHLYSGNGCNDIDACHQNVSFCGKHAICFDNPAPSLNATCVCPHNYIGNGYDGCEDQAVYVVKIAIPLIIVAMLLLTYLAWRIRLYQAYKHDIQWSQFVSNDTLLYNLPNDEEINLSDVCTPAFGQKWELDRSTITMGDIIGRGNYGVVYRGTYSPIRNDDYNVYNEISDTVAIKTIKEGYNEKADLLEFFAEIGFMLNVGEHPNVLGVIGCCTTQRPVLLITEYLKYGDLLHFLWDTRESEKGLVDPVYHVTEKSLCQMARQVAVGMEYLTKTRIIHGDLAARNILVGEDLICKISDFGLANDVYRYGIIQGQTERLVPFKWISPERMMEGKVPITSKSDVWSFGNLMYEMVTLGCMPHPGISAGDLLGKLKGGYRMEQPSTCSDQLYSIMSKCWKWRAHSRPSFTQLTRMFSKIIFQNVNELHVRNLAVEVQHLDREEYIMEINQTNNDVLFVENQHSGHENENDRKDNSPPAFNAMPKSILTENDDIVIANRHAPLDNEESQV